VANWNFLAGDTSYAAMVARAVGRTGAVDHFWSLAIEEQFYWAWPVVAWLVLRHRFDLRRWTFVVGVLTAAAITSAFVIGAVWGAEAAYWATPARAAEILTGALAASVVARPDLRERVIGSRSVALLGLVGLAVVVAVAVTWPASGSPADHGWLSVVSFASVAVVLGAMAPGPLGGILGLAPFCWLGRVSYGVYLYHWPVFAVLDADRVGADGVTLLAVRLAVTLLVAAASYRWLEEPIRHGVRASSWAPRAVAVRGVAGLAALVVLAVAVVPADESFDASDRVPSAFAPVESGPVEPGPVEPAPDDTGPVEPGGPSENSVTTDPSAGAASTSTTRPASEPAGRVLLVGDSTAVTLADAFLEWSTSYPRVQFASLASVGCGLVRDSVALGTKPEDAVEILDRCGRILDERVPEILAETPPDVAVVLVTLPDAVERTWTEEEGVLSPSDPRFRERMVADYARLADQLADGGVGRVVWVVPARPTDQFLRNVVNPIEDSDWETFLGVIRATAARHPDIIELLDLEEWCATNDPDASLRPDGLHIARDVARVAVDGAFAQRLLELLSE
jgi:peptidoglycan/LPS O-acetylase OafA/YrhL